MADSETKQPQRREVDKDSLASQPQIQTPFATSEKQDATTLELAPSSPRSSISQPPEEFPELYFTYKWSNICLYALFLFFCNFIFPCILFYPLETLTSLTDHTVVGISSAALGLSSCFDSPLRLWRLIKFRRIYGPFEDDVWWHLDFSMWAYTIALFIFAVPLAIAPGLKLFDFFLMSTVLLVGPVGVIFLFSTFGLKVPFRCSSDPAGSQMKPAVFYLIEDVASVDFQHGRDFRRTLYRRYHASPPFRRLMMNLTIYWVISSAVYCGATAAVTWTTPFRFAFGYTLGQLFIWGALSAVGCKLLARKGLRDERKWLQSRKEFAMKERSQETIV
ncbi:hypothetical protein CPB83DRAFT_864229 [Crepidotus variabilis]|uniref:Uncharacterized protein n=1 Tax=Crepidotus variabilis TaxID=179855 RepID=A0A9P6E4T9_9AGAR|nr:hypothetical protein CPB83DRAFT_864229 [Crepidotus variabilis]